MQLAQIYCNKVIKICEEDKQGSLDSCGEAYFLLGQAAKYSDHEKANKYYVKAQDFYQQAFGDFANQHSKVQQVNKALRILKFLRAAASAAK